jgi:hypothetical protein
MATVKLIKLPKKPKKTASIATLERYLKKVAEIKKENTKRTNAEKKREGLNKKIGSLKR